MTKSAVFTIFEEWYCLKRVNLKGFRGFTLAEVLITLVIIGVIAAMTIPTLINNTNKHEYASKLKKVYSAMAQATNKIITEEGNPQGDIGGWANTTENVYNMYIKHLNKAKACGTDTTCINHDVYKFNGELSTVQMNANTYRKFILADGTQVSLGDALSTSCTNNVGNGEKTCLEMFVDVNGDKGPNRLGIDVFSFLLDRDGLFPRGCNNICPDISSVQKQGINCACKVLREGAINY